MVISNGKKKKKLLILARSFSVLIKIYNFSYTSLVLLTEFEVHTVSYGPSFMA